MAFWHRPRQNFLRVPRHQGLRALFGSGRRLVLGRICISSESCLWLNVGFGRLLCFGTLRSALSAKVALGELLRLCPGSAGLSTSVEKAKTDCHDKARDWSLFGEVFLRP